MNSYIYIYIYEQKVCMYVTMHVVYVCVATPSNNKKSAYGLKSLKNRALR